MLKVVGASWTQTRFSTFLIAAVAGLGLVTILFGEIPRDVYDGRYAATVFWNEKSGFRIEFWGQGNDPNAIRRGVARAYYRPDMLTTGWAVLEIETQSNYPDWVQTHAAGLLEGSLSWQLIYWHWQNTIESTCEGRDDFCDEVTSFLENNTAIIRDKANELASIDPFWHQIKLFYSQLDGLEVGWRHAVKRSRQEDNVDIPHTDFLWLNIMSDFKDLEMKMNSSKELNHKPPLSFALLKLLPDKLGQFVMTHATAGRYSSMLRVQKRYKFGLHEFEDPDASLVTGQVMVFTSYPGSLHSQDDFYQITGSSSALVVAGTYLKNYNSYLWQLFDSMEEVLVGPRVLAANRLAKTPEKWAEYVSINSSGTGNKQWLIVQHNHKTTKNVSLWVVEQLPGLTHAKDVSSDLEEAGYWTSYGSPIFEDIIDLGGYRHQDLEDFTAARLLLQQGQENGRLPGWRSGKRSTDPPCKKHCSEADQLWRSK
ncbi:putative phospholipase B-like lamina ancestor isoform X2 [Lycorma delicatula]|uniref:putative phospholipase B-like lamina ancestor isoform X2 n=1 Tax=Lycorma delicatula TaxID=130591 RepID=UPI003F5133A9